MSILLAILSIVFLLFLFVGIIGVIKPSLVRQKTRGKAFVVNIIPAILITYSN